MVAPPSLVRIPLGRAVDQYLERVRAQASVGRLSPRTAVNYERDLREFVQIVGEGTIVDDITGEDLDDALLMFGQVPDGRFLDPAAKGGPGRGLGTQKRFRQSVSRFFTLAARDGWVQANPMAWARLDPDTAGPLRSARTSLTPDQADALLRWGAGESDAPDARSHERNYARDKCLLALLLLLGPRVSEVCQANMGDFSASSPSGDRSTTEWTWRVRGKGNKPRDLPLSPYLVGLRAAYLQVRPDPGAHLAPPQSLDASQAMFLTGRGARLQPRDVQRLLTRARLKVAAHRPDLAREVTPHALRHTAATVLLSSGWDVKVVQQLLGHSNIAITSKYLDKLPGELAHAVAAHPLTPKA